ncbi:hypothetical protein ANN_03473 [Periplaneta americana]|uniref:Uncharacterized protein n=1 Tax=Periplaneta americana TaxID=6978 RepID=A0ABQ8TZ20_PERAM|nr:hypothetical protein ANN_03473 [Periplaneta americana]
MRVRHSTEFKRAIELHCSTLAPSLRKYLKSVVTRYKSVLKEVGNSLRYYKTCFAIMYGRPKLKMRAPFKRFDEANISEIEFKSRFQRFNHILRIDSNDSFTILPVCDSNYSFESSTSSRFFLVCDSNDSFEPSTSSRFFLVCDSNDSSTNDLSSHSCHYRRYRTYRYVLFRMNAVLARQLLCLIGYTPLRKAEIGSTRRVDILAYNADTKQGIIVDPTICFEVECHQPAEVHLEKKSTSEPTVNYFKLKYALIHVEPLPFVESSYLKSVNEALRIWNRICSDTFVLKLLLSRDESVCCTKFSESERKCCGLADSGAAGYCRRRLTTVRNSWNENTVRSRLLLSHRQYMETQDEFDGAGEEAVRQSKIIHYMPKNFVTTGYTLSNKAEIKGIKYSDVVEMNKKKQMVQVPNTEDFETVIIYGISKNIHGNLTNRNKMYQGYILNDLESQNMNCVVDESGDKDTKTNSWTIESRAISRCKNLDKMEIVGASDVIEYDVETNVEGDLLYPDPVDPLFPTPFSYFTVKGMEKVSVNTVKGRLHPVAQYF